MVKNGTTVHSVCHVGEIQPEARPMKHTKNIQFSQGVTCCLVTWGNDFELMNGLVVSNVTEIPVNDARHN